MRTTVKCPTCRKETQWQDNPYRPFCSARCRTTDLGAWAMESYHISGEKADDQSEESPESRVEKNSESKNVRREEGKVHNSSKS